MTDNEYRILREALGCLPYTGTPIKVFAQSVNLAPHTIYNYISGQKPSDKTYRYILYTLTVNHSEAIEHAQRIINMQEANK